MKQLQVRRLAIAAAAAALLATLPLGAASEKIDYEAINKIKREGMQNSKVMELSSWLTDVYGPRVTGAPMMEKGAQWAMQQMKEWGLQNVAIEKWTDQNNFKSGWTNDKFYMAVVAPQPFPIPGTPMAWTPGTEGLVKGDVILVTETTQEELQKYAGKLRGKWILTQPAPDVAAYWDAPSRRYTKDALDALELNPPAAPEFGVPNPNAGRGGPGRAGQPFAARGGQAPFNRIEFFKAEGALGTISTAPRGHGIYTVGGSRTADPEKSVPSIAIGAEQYGRMARMIAKNVPVTIEAEIKNTFYPNPPMFNVVGEIPGTDLKDEIVLLGAHFDTWHAGTGATDNAAGSAAMLEAMRILKQSGVKLRRTVRIGLWTGEEQGLIGSREYVNLHLVTRGPAPAAPAAGAAPAAPGQPGGGRGAAAGPITLKPDHAKFAAYFNIDNGTGAIRGVYLQGNEAVAPIFREWMEPFRSMGMTTLTLRNTGGTDHQSFDAVGLPGFQFIQDEVEYNAITHHTNLDTYERLQPSDMMKNATIAASFAYLAANRDEKLPRKPLPPNVVRGTGSNQ